MSRFVNAAKDEQFPHLPVAADAAAMQEILQRRLPGFAEGRMLISRVQIKDFEYKPGRKCAICYAVRAHDPATGRQGRQLFLGVLEPRSRAQIELAAAPADELATPEFGPARHALPELNMVLWAFPNDPKIKGLPVLAQAGSLQTLLNETGALSKTAGSGPVQCLETQVVKYVPQRRCTFRHVLHLHAGTAQQSELVVYSKIYRAKTDAGLFFKNLQGIWEAPVCRSGALLVPEPLFHAAALNAVFQRGLRGRNLDEMLHEIDPAEVSARLGLALAGLQQCALAGLEHRPPAEEFDEFKKTQKALLACSSAHAPALQKIEHELARGISGLSALAPVPIHGAFRPTQVLMVGDQIAVIDFDGFLMGNPLADAGSFIAHLIYLPLKGLLSETQSRAAIRQFARAYGAAAPWGMPEKTLRWYIAANLAGREAKKCLDKSRKVSKRDYEDMIGALLRHAVDTLAGGSVLD